MTGTRKLKSRNLSDNGNGHKPRAVNGSSAAADRHAVRFYESDSSLARIVADFLNEGFERGTPGIVVATAGQRAQIIQALAARSCDAVGLQRSEDVGLLDAEETLATFIIEGRPGGRDFKDHTSHCIGRVSR